MATAGLAGVDTAPVARAAPVAKEPHRPVAHETASDGVAALNPPVLVMDGNGMAEPLWVRDLSLGSGRRL
jgi:hypothetical protein